jgi:hypothetical protein
MNKEKILMELEILLIDCEAQRDSLRVNNDVNWNCYQPENWDSMVKAIKRIKKELKNEK